ncbi:MAG: TIR domain-containing protein [Dehalococcoidia bacterium]
MVEQPSTREPYVFLSYTSADRDRVLLLADRLESAGIRVWLDRRSLVGGMSWDAAIVRAIKDCTVFAVLCTPASVTSPNVMQELRLAWEDQRPTLPVLLAPVSFPDELRYILAGRQWVEVLERSEVAWLPELQNALAGLGLVAALAQPGAAPAVAAPVVRPPTNLPAALTSFLGRGRELRDLAQLLGSNRLVTLTGPGGTGKTRLALQAAWAQVAAFLDGVFFVDLSSLQDPTLVPSAVAQALGIQGNPDLPLRESVLRFMRDKQLLLVLDNYEQLLSAAEFAGTLLQGAPQVSLLVTSRAPLRVPGEREFPVAPLPLPLGAVGTAAGVAENPAVALFELRARDVRPEFELTDENAATVAAICTRLDGLPLAIELAAARVRVLPPTALLARLEQRLPVLTGGARTVPARQQTLRGAIAWSYDLLEPAEQRLFRQLGVFAGGCTLELAEVVCNADGDLGLDMLDGVSSLLEKSLLREADGLGGEPRYRMLETIREFAHGELDASGEAEAVRHQLAVQMLQLAQHAAAARDWARLDVELDNTRAVLGWCVETNEPAVGVRLFWALRGYLVNRGHGNEQQAWRHRLLALPEAVPPSIARARLLACPPVDLFSSAEQASALDELVEASDLSRELGDSSCLALALTWLVLLRLEQGQYDAVELPAAEALTLYLGAGDARGAAQMQTFRIAAALALGDTATAERLLAAIRALETTTRSPVGLESEALLAEAQGDDARAREFLEEVGRRAVAEQGEQSPFRLHQLASLARLTQRQGDTPAVVATCAVSLAVQRQIGASRYLGAVLTVLAQAAERHRLLAESARLLAAVAVQRRHFAAEMPGLPEAQQAAIDRVRAALDEAAFAKAWSAGEALSADASIEFGLAVVEQLQQRLATDTRADPLS